jgi:Rad3-related DNA helicase
LRPLFVRFARAWRALAGVQRETYQAYPAIPASITAALQRLIAGLAEHLAAAPDAGPAAGPAAEPAHGPADETAPAEGGLLQFYFAALHFNRMAEAFGRHSLFDISLGPDEVLCVRNVIPAPFLAPRFAASATNVLFSATLAPPAFYRELLGLPADAAWTEIGAPFSADQLVVRVKRGISTRYLDRASSVDPIVAVIAGQYRLQPGNYLAFFSSFDYLRQVLARFRAHCPGIAAFAQEPRMRADAREEFLARFTAGNRGIGFAVLGGAFAEGIDLPGECLIGAFIATLGLPQINPVNAEFARRMHESFGTGYEYAYLYPGLQKVVQAAGRVIRTPSDRGTVYLMDDRFTRGDVRALLPKWWRVEHA